MSMYSTFAFAICGLRAPVVPSEMARRQDGWRAGISARSFSYSCLRSSVKAIQWTKSDVTSNQTQERANDEERSRRQSNG